MTWSRWLPLRLAFLLLPIAPLAAQVQSADKEVTARIQAGAIPGMVAAVFGPEAVLATGVAGVRETGKPEAIVIADRFHIGSNAKAMLATLAALLVEEGKLSWETRPVELLPAPGASAAYARLTLAQLLNHHAGLPAFEDESAPEWKAWVAYRQKTGPQGQPAGQFAHWVLTQPPAEPPGTKGLYSNAGYSIAAAMVERAGGMGWKELLGSRLFAPLKMDADFGLPALRPNQPQGHYETPGGLTVQPATERVAPFMQPAGDVQLGVLEYVKFLQQHLRGLNGRDGLLKAATVRALHTPTDKLGFGWRIGDFQGAPASFHTGSADTFYAIATLLPESAIGVVVLTNAGGERSAAACLETTRELLARFVRPPPAAPKRN